MEGSMNNQRKIIGHGLPLRYPRRANIIENNSRSFSKMFPSAVPLGPTMFPSTVPLRPMMSQSTIPLGPVMFPSTVPLGPVMSPYMVPLAPPSAVSLAPTTFEIWNRSNTLNFSGNSSTDQAMASSSSSSSSSIITVTSSTSSRSNNDIGKGKGLMMDPSSPISDKNSVPVADAPTFGHDNTTNETNTQTGFQFNACRVDPANMDEKKHRRTMSNRLSAERIRKKRAQYVSELERKLKNLEVRIAVQRPQISQDNKEHVQFLQMGHLKRLNQILTYKKKGLMRIDASIAQNKEAVKIWRQQELIQQQKMMQTQQRHQQKQHQHQQKIMLMQQQQQQQQRMPVWEDGLEGIINPNPSSNQSSWLDQQQMGYPNSIQGIYGVNPEEMNSNWLNQQQFPMNQPAAMVYGVAPAETNGGHELLILNINRLNQQQVPMNQSAAAEYGGSINDDQLLMNYQPQPGQSQMMAPPDNWDQFGMVQMPNPNSKTTINPNYQLDELEQFKNLNLNPPNLPN